MRRSLDERRELLFGDDRSRFELVARGDERIILAELVEHTISGGHVVETRSARVSTQKRPADAAQVALDRLVVANRDQCRAAVTARLAKRESSRGAS